MGEGQGSSLRRPMRFRRFLEREYHAMADSQEAGTVDSRISEFGQGSSTRETPGVVSITEWSISSGGAPLEERKPSAAFLRDPVQIPPICRLPN
jgi:hypothetical protein